MLGTGHWNGGNSVSGDRVNAWVHRATQYIALGIAVVLVAATLGILSPSRAYAASAFVQDRDTEVTSGTTASWPSARQTPPGNLIAVYVVWDNPGTVDGDRHEGRYLHGGYRSPDLGQRLECGGLLRPEPRRRV